MKKKKTGGLMIKDVTPTMTITGLIACEIVHALNELLDEDDQIDFKPSDSIQLAIIKHETDKNKG